ncbi:MAG: VanZ family protein [Bacteroidales bacterium]|nr:VanZ family protein [Bacteroidales bacterium]
MNLLRQITKKQYNIALVIWTIIVLTLLLIPSSSFSHTPKLINIPHSDKFAHFILFGVLSFLLFKNMEFIKKKLFLNIYLLNILYIFLFGLLTETLQGLMYNTAKRNFSLGDLAFDTLASITVMCIMFALNKRKK